MPKKKPETKTVRLQSPGAGTYRINLFSEDLGPLSSEIMLSGERDQKELVLPAVPMKVEIDEVGVRADTDGVYELANETDGNILLSEIIKSGLIVKKPKKSRTRKYGVSRSYSSMKIANPVTQKKEFFGLTINNQTPGLEGFSSSKEEYEFQTNQMLGSKIVVGITEIKDAFIRRAKPLGHNELDIKVESKGRGFKIKLKPKNSPTSAYIDIAVEGKSPIRVPAPFYKNGLIVELQPSSVHEKYSGISENSKSNTDISLVMHAVSKSDQNLLSYLDVISPKESLVYVKRILEKRDNDLIGHYLQKEDIWTALLASVVLTRVRLIHNEMDSLKKLMKHTDNLSLIHI